jgi:hypothetical protein
MANALNIITGNSLGEGLVVFQIPGGGWSLDIGHAEVLETPEALAAATARANADAAANRVVEPYAVEVTRSGARLVPVRLREQIRADGPTVGHSKDKDSAVSEEAA